MRKYTQLVAITALSLAFAAKGGAYAAVEGRSMIIGALALWLYSVTVCQLMQRGRFSALPATVVALLVWFAVALLGGMLLLRGPS